MAQCASQEALLKLLTDELPEEESAGLSEHVQECARCQNMLDELSDDTELRVWARQSLQAPFQPHQDEPVLVELVDRLHEAEEPGLTGPPPDTSHSTIFRDGIRQGEELKVLRRIGRGGMGEVYEAHQPSLDRSVAIKLLPHWLADDPDALERFRREAAVTARLDHPNIVPIYAFGQWGDRWYYTMKLVRGVSLAELIRWRFRIRTAKAETRTLADDDTGTGHRPTTQLAELPGVDFAPEIRESLRPVCEDYVRDPCEFTRRVGRQAARALAYAHQHGQIHRDIKPSNIMIDGHSQVYLIDFGLTRAISQTITQHRAGTLRYMSPEQLDLRELDGRTDIFSLGVTLYELASGQHPFGDNPGEPSELVARIREGAVRPAEISGSLGHALDRALRRDPENRFPDAQQFGAAIEGATTSRLLQPSRKSSSKWLRALPQRRMWRIGMAGAVGAAVLLVLLASWPTGGNRRQPDFAPMMWNDLLTSAPEELLKLSKNPRSAPVFVRESGELRIDSFAGQQLLKLGEAPRTGYKVRIGLLQNPWEGRVGLVFGFREMEPGVFTYQSIELQRARAFMGHEAVDYLNRLRIKLHRPNSADGEIAEERVTLAAAPIQLGGAGEHVLEIWITGNGLWQVTWDGQAMPDLSDEEVNSTLTQDDYIGDIGVYNHKATTLFRNARIMFYGVE